MTQKMVPVVGTQKPSFLLGDGWWADLHDPSWPCYAWQTLPSHHHGLINYIHRTAVSLEVSRIVPQYWRITEAIVADTKQQDRPRIRTRDPLRFQLP